MMTIEERDDILREFREGKAFYTELKSQMPKYIQEALNRIEEFYDDQLDNLDYSDVDECVEWQVLMGLEGWEVFFCPEVHNYKFVINNIRGHEIVFDACAGDLRLDLLLSQLCKKVYAVEINPKIIGKSIELIGYDMPPNLITICSDILKIPLPSDVTTIVLLHRHFIHKLPKEWWEKKIITNNHYSPLKCHNSLPRADEK